MSTLTVELKQKILALAGNPAHAVIERLTSIPNGFRILQRTFFYDKSKKRSGSNKKAIGVVIDGAYLSSAQYRAKYTRRGQHRVIIPESPAKPKRDNVGVSDAPLSAQDGAIYSRMLGPVPILYALAERHKLVEDLYAAFGPEVGKEILSIAMHWIVGNDNAARHFSSFAQAYALPFPGKIDEEHIAKLYSFLGHSQGAVSKLFSLRCSRLKDKACVAYDSTSIPTAAQDIYFQQNSMKKESVIGPMVHLALLAAQETGMPVMYRLFNGATPDCVTVTDLMKRIAELAGDKDLLFVFDRGYETLDNLLACSKDHRACIMAAKSLEQQFIAEVIDEYSDFWDASSVMPGTCIHAHTKKVEISHHNEKFDVWVHVYRDDGKSAVEHRAFFGHLDMFELEWKASAPTARVRMQNDPLMKFYKLSDPNAATLERDPIALNDHTRRFGFFSNITLTEMSALDAYRIYRNRDSIEKCFKSGKLSLNMDTARAHRQDTMEGRMVIAFVSLIILAALKYELGQERSFPDLRRKTLPAHRYTVQDVLNLSIGVHVAYAEKTQKTWILGKLKELKRLCTACGVNESLYDSVPEYVATLSDLRTA